MNKEQINSIFSSQNQYTIQPLNEEGYSINNDNNGMYFFYYSEKNNDILYVFSLLSTIGNFPEKQKTEIYKKILQLNLPTSSQHLVKLGMTKSEELFLSTILDIATLTSDSLKQKLATFFAEVQSFQSKLTSILENTETENITPQTQDETSLSFALNNFIRI